MRTVVGLTSLIVLATKYTTNFKGGPNGKHITANFVGNNAKSLHTSVEASLKKLQTDYIDIVSDLMETLKCEGPTDSCDSSTSTGTTLQPLSLN